MKPTVSVITPAYNYGKYIAETIESVLSQSFTDFEYIILNNASEDNTDEVVKRYLHDPRIIYVLNESNIGSNANFNKGIEIANGKYLIFLSADDFFLPNNILNLIAKITEFPEADFVYGRYVFINSNGEFTELVSHPAWVDFDHPNFYNEVGRLLAFDCYIPFSCTLFNAGVFKKNGVLDEEIVVGDYDYFIKPESVT